MDEAPGQDYVQRLGRKVWHLKHKIADEYGCPTCRPAAIRLANLEHNVVNIHLGKKVVDPSLFEEGVKMVADAWNNYRGRSHHSANLRIGSHHVHVVSDIPGAVETFKQEARGTLIRH